jgi:hypothetical protein
VLHYPHVVTFEEPTRTRLPSGQETRTYAAVTDLTDLPARIVPEQLEDPTAAMVIETDRFTVVVQGDREIERSMRMVSDYLDAELSVVRVQRPVLYRSPATIATIVTAEKVTASVGAGS